MPKKNKIVKIKKNKPKKNINKEEAELKQLLKNKKQNPVTLKFIKADIRKIENAGNKIRKRKQNEINLRVGGRLDTIDWGYQDALIRYYYHCDPLDLTLPQYTNLMVNLGEILAMEHGGGGEKNTEEEL